MGVELVAVFVDDAPKGVLVPRASRRDELALSERFIGRTAIPPR
jgi:hypothetical protein